MGTPIEKVLLGADDFKEGIDKIVLALHRVSASNGGEVEITTWAQVQALVRDGLAPKVFSVGDEFIVKRGTTDIKFVVMGFNQETPVDSSRTHSMTLAMKYTFDGIVFDAREAFFYNGTNDALPAGTYNFKMGAQSWFAGDVGKYIQFTLTQPLPKGGQLVFTQSYNATAIGANIKVFASPDTLDSAPTETVVMSEGQEGTYLGELKNGFNTSGTYDIYLNHCQRALMGSNRWSTSAIRQWCNGNLDKDHIWHSTNPFDRQPSWFKSKDGFLYGVDEDLLAVIGECVKDTELATCDYASGQPNHEETHDKVWLFDRFEIQSCSQAEALTHKPYDWWHALLGDTYGDWRTDTRFIKTNTGGAAQYWWLRSPSTGSGGFARTVYTSGHVYYDDAISWKQAAVVFAII